jgi:hypothetical protein
MDSDFRDCGHSTSCGYVCLGTPRSEALHPRAWGQEFCQGLNRRDGILAQRQDDALQFMRVECLDIADGLGLRQGAKGERFSRDTEIGSHLIDEL